MEHGHEGIKGCHVEKNGCVNILFKGEEKMYNGSKTNRKIIVQCAGRKITVPTFWVGNNAVEFRSKIDTANNIPTWAAPTTQSYLIVPSRSPQWLVASG